MIFQTLFAWQPQPGSFEHLILTLPLPIGISFFTFEGISLLVDVYKAPSSQKLLVGSTLGSHLRSTMLFVSFFPHLVSGPILKAHDFLPQIGEKLMKDIPWDFVVRTLILGYFFKNVIADNLQDQTFWLHYPEFKMKSTLSLLTLLFGYSIQIFADFAGYSLIALGLAALFGYRIINNFNYPYIATSFSEFWQRWHISLSSWLKEYLYIPLGGNRSGQMRTYLNLFIVMFLGGLWHGAAWSYAIWGVMHGVALAVEKAIQPITLTIPALVRGVFVFGYVSFCWLFFKLTDFSHAVVYLQTLITNVTFKEFSPFVPLILIYSLPVVLYYLLYLIRLNWKPAVHFVTRTESLIYAILLFFVVFNTGSSNAFIYFQF